MTRLKICKWDSFFSCYSDELRDLVQEFSTSDDQDQDEKQDEDMSQDENEDSKMLDENDDDLKSPEEQEDDQPQKNGKLKIFFRWNSQVFHQGQTKFKQKSQGYFHCLWYF